MCLSLEVRCLLFCLIPDGVVYKGEPYLTSRSSCILCDPLVTGFQLFQLHECLIMSACIVLDYMNNPLIQLGLFED